MEKITEKIKEMGGLFPRETCFEVMRKLKIDTTPFKRKRTGKVKVEKKGKGSGKSATSKKTGTPKKTVKKSAHKETIVETDVEEEADLDEFANEEADSF